MLFVFHGFTVVPVEARQAGQLVAYVGFDLVNKTALVDSVGRTGGRLKEAVDE